MYTVAGMHYNTRLRSISTFLLVSLTIINQATTVPTEVVNENAAEPEWTYPTINAEDCGSEFAELINLELNPPCNSTPCIVNRAEAITLKSTWVSKVDNEYYSVQINQVDPNFGFYTQLFPEFSACGRFELGCPTKAGVPTTSVLSRHLPMGLPPFRLILRVILYGDNRSVFLCKQLPIEIV